LVPYYARDEGFFTRAGLDVDLLPQPNVAAGVQAVLAGAADVAQADIIMLANAAIHGLPLTMIAGAAIYRARPNPPIGILVSNDSPYRTARDLQGKSMGVVSLSSLSAIAGREWIRVHGGDPSTVRLVEMPFSQMPAALQRGLIDVAVEVDPYIHGDAGAALRNLGDVYATIAPFYLAVWVAQKPWVAQNDAAVRRFIETIYTTARWANTHQSDTAPLFAKYGNYDPDVVRNTTRTVYATSLEPNLLDSVLAAAYRYKAIAEPVKSADLMYR
jgi:NitT/TauT family transport system substrate-binding protein